MRERSLALPMEVEASSLVQVQEVLGLLSSEPQCMVTRIMLDNMIRIDPTGVPPIFLMSNTNYPPSSIDGSNEIIEILSDIC